jgi:hypothetical protein
MVHLFEVASGSFLMLGVGEEAWEGLGREKEIEKES